jgi:pimeloyl-ACP methyl ester carboxylesterase
MAEHVKLHYTERGAGLPVVLIHGFPFDRRIWDAQAESLSETYRMITPDLRGHGQSPVPDGVYSMDVMAQDIVALLDDLGIERAVWAGHSMGGYITMAALRIAPERIAGVAFVATHPHPDSNEKRAGRLATAERVLSEGSGIMVDAMRPIMFAPGFDTESDRAHAMVEMMAATSPVGIAGALRGMAERLASVETLHDLTVPAVVIAGEDDQIVALEVAKQMIAEMPSGTKLVTIPGAGHMPMIEHPAATTIALREFLHTHYDL